MSTHPSDTLSLHLRPLSLGEILDQSLRLYRRNFLTFTGAAAIVMLPLNLFQFFLLLFTQMLQLQMLGNTGDPSTVLVGSMAVLGGSAATGLLSLVLTVIAQTAVSRAAADAFLNQPSGAVQAYRRLGPVAGNLAVMVMLLGALSIGLSIWGFVIPCVGWLTGPAALIFLYAAVAPMASVIIALERHTPFDVIRRAWEMARQRFWWMLGFSIVLGLFRTAISFGPAALLEWAALSLASNDSLLQSQVLSTVISSLSTLFITIIMTPFVAVAFTLVYFDLRVRYEGLDLLIESSPKVEDIAQVTSLAIPPQGELLRSQDMFNLAKVSLLIIGLYIGMVAVIVGLGVMVQGLASF